MCIPPLAVIIPNESIFVTSSYVNVPPTVIFPPTCKSFTIPTPPVTCNAPVVDEVALLI